MLTEVGGVEIFAKAFPGIECPQCSKLTLWLSTTNEWEYHCVPCDIRFNRAGQKYDGSIPSGASTFTGFDDVQDLNP